MSVHRSADMSSPRRTQTAGQKEALPGKSASIHVPQGGEVHIRRVANGVVASARDSNYNTVLEVFADSPEALSLTTSSD